MGGGRDSIAETIQWEVGGIVLLKLFSGRRPLILPSRAECRSALVYAIGVQPFYGKGPNPLLWADSRAASGRQQTVYQTACIGCVDWMQLVQDRDRWRALVSAVMNLRVP